MDNSIVIIGGGLAAAKTAEALRTRGYDGALVVVAGEDHVPYERPPLSKEFLAGKTESAELAPFDAQWYATHRVDLRTGVSATQIDSDAKMVTLDDGSSLAYDTLVLATGSRPRPFPGEPEVAYLRTVDDSERLRERLGEDRSLVIVGGGWIGLEAAATARAAGTSVTVIEPERLPLERILGAEIAAAIADLHRSNGVDLRLSTGVESIRVQDAPGGTVFGDDASTHTADTILVGIGAVPNVALAEEAGLSVSNGVDVDAGLRTSDPNIFAVGDIANHDHPLFGRIRIEHWANALNQPAVAAANILGGDEVYDRLPYFFTDQFSFSMEYRGHASGSDAVVIRGDLSALEFLAFWLDEENRVRAGMNVNLWDDGDAIAELITSQRSVDPVRLGDRAIALDSV
ncbi:putative ferredoxin reductase [Gordonia hirsuta DSM 44140 = NBRC 16056]|uniref:Putative ferredoxin reductase n=1 Tax=Gordonia hirsuta DSM 44140 = NBRC 16056 TaxID=1121927 RepID=L7LC96_9ACTN|nr:FAD-dependent oxidoreductase [Gordonia hirsuta]GAC58514.1 putative ferredoxin reductase [Gordonia hirsuta DSM 44140 = NBRC 16056]